VRYWEPHRNGPYQQQPETRSVQPLVNNNKEYHDDTGNAGWP